LFAVVHLASPLTRLAVAITHLQLTFYRGVSA
jgi:hypothetical protein